MDAFRAVPKFFLYERMLFFLSSKESFAFSTESHFIPTPDESQLNELVSRVSSCFNPSYFSNPLSYNNTFSELIIGTNQVCL